MEKLIKDFEIPNKKIETWKFTDLKKIFEKNNFKPFIKPSESTDKSIPINPNISKNIFFNSKINFVIFENGCLKKINVNSNHLEIKSLKNKSKKKIFFTKYFFF